jgi:hypothetical protein
MCVCVCVHHVVCVLWSQIIWMPVVLGLNPIMYLIWTCSTLSECTHHDRWNVCTSFCMALAVNVFRGQHCYLLSTFDRRIIVSFGKPSSKASHAKLHASKVVSFYAMKTYKAYRGVAPPILNLGTWCKWVVNIMPHLPYPKKIKYCTHRIGGWVGSRVSGYFGEKRNLYPAWDSSHGSSSP